MAEYPTHVCHICKKTFRTDEMAHYATLRSKKAYWYCAACHNEVIEKEKFSEKVCQIFGLKAPGPRIWTERKRLKDTYGYTDSILVDSLDYIYNIQKKKKLSESLCLINPTLVEQMMDYKRQLQAQTNKIVETEKVEQVEYVVPIKENTKKISNKWDPDEWLDED